MEKKRKVCLPARESRARVERMDKIRDCETVSVAKKIYVHGQRDNQLYEIGKKRKGKIEWEWKVSFFSKIFAIKNENKAGYTA